MARAFSMDRQAILAENSLLKHLDPADRAQLAEYAQVVRYGADELIFQRGDAGAGMMAVVTGRVKICAHSVEGKELILNIIKPGEVFGEISLIDGEPRTADAVALETCQLLLLERRDFQRHLDQNPRMAQRLLGILCQRLRRTSAAFEESLFLEVPARLARVLLHLSRAYGIPAKAGVCIDVKLSQQQLGAIAGITRESVNKQLGLWQKAGWIAVRNGYVTVTEAGLLAEVAGLAEHPAARAPAREPDRPRPGGACP
ncbi:MAG TPA: Crp/Fnr family transcriptional regulator [Magnetospirillum sp.]|nr:Crp/Fnr family transcriptional regulator [Magnetospirillum sp.]